MADPPRSLQDLINGAPSPSQRTWLAVEIGSNSTLEEIKRYFSRQRTQDALWLKNRSLERYTQRVEYWRQGSARVAYATPEIVRELERSKIVYRGLAQASRGEQPILRLEYVEGSEGQSPPRRYSSITGVRG